MRVSLRFLSFAVAALWLVATAGSASFAASAAQPAYTTNATHPLRTALLDPWQLKSGSPEGFQMTRKAGAQYVRLLVLWSQIAPAMRPDGFVAADPASPGYSWSGLDA